MFPRCTVLLELLLDLLDLIDSLLRLMLYLMLRRLFLKYEVFDLATDRFILGPSSRLRIINNEGIFF